MTYTRLTERRKYSTGIYVEKRSGKMEWKDAYDLVENERSESVDEVIERLAELEDKIEQGTLIELPCKVGDTIWVVDESWGHREDGTWGSTSEMHEGKVYSFTYYGNCLHVEDDFTSNCYLWGEDAFLTREEAENKLKELQE